MLTPRQPHQPSRVIASLLIALLSCSEFACIRRAASPRESVAPSSGVPFGLADPDASSVKLSPVAVSTSAFAGALKLPTFTLQQTQANFVKILRCQASYREYLSYMMLQAEKQEVKNRHGRKWVWIDSFGDVKNCKLAAQRFAGSEFQDIGARNGQFFYIINPCASAEFSNSGVEECSNLLSVTETLTYKDSPSTTVLAKTAELSDAEAEYEAVYLRLLGLSRKILNEKEACEFAMVQVETQRNVNNAGWDLVAAAVAIGAGLGVRALLSERSMGWIADQLSAKNPNAAKFVAEVGTTSSAKKNLVVAGLAGGALAIALGIKNATASRGGTLDDPSCQRADALAAEVLAIEDQKLLEQAQKKMSTLSADLRRLDSSFVGYQ